MDRRAGPVGCLPDNLLSPRGKSCASPRAADFYYIGFSHFRAVLVCKILVNNIGIGWNKIKAEFTAFCRLNQTIQGVER